MHGYCICMCVQAIYYMSCMHVYTFCRQLVIKCISMGTIDINIAHLENSMCAIMAHLAVLL